MYKNITKCRVCGNAELKSILNLGNQSLTGVFPHPGEYVEDGPLELVKCMGGCGLVQLHHSFEADKMYGDNYGYRSGLNRSMVKHLTEIVKKIENTVSIEKDDVILDIGSNDGTLLAQYLNRTADFIGMDPTGNKFRKYYRDDIELIPDFFSFSKFDSIRKEKKAKVITSIAMFYDLENPIQFARDIEKCLADDGIWIFEQSYFPAMLNTNSYDTVCHEHLEFYCLKQIIYILNHSGLKAIKVENNSINGGSFQIVASKKDSNFVVDDSIEEMINYEKEGAYDELTVLDHFKNNIEENRRFITDFLNECLEKNKLVIGYGASTKGNVMLQYCGIGKEQVPYIADVNEDKFGRVTPGTCIPIISEEEARRKKPDYFLVLPWHFKEGILNKEKEYMKTTGCAFVFGFPKLEIVRYEDSL